MADLVGRVQEEKKKFENLRDEIKTFDFVCGPDYDRKFKEFMDKKQDILSHIAEVMRPCVIKMELTGNERAKVYNELFDRLLNSNMDQHYDELFGEVRHLGYALEEDIKSGYHNLII